MKKGFTTWFKDIKIEDVGLVGGKNAALGEIFCNLVPFGINVPDGFAVTAEAYDYFLEKAGVKGKIKKELLGLNTRDVVNLKRRGGAIRSMILKAAFPEDLKNEILSAYNELGQKYGAMPDVAVRSSATAEDLPGASFAGQQETFLNVRGGERVLIFAKKAMASLFTDRAISYREDKGFSHLDVSLSVGIQKMVRSDMASSGVAFTVDTETGFDKVIIINSSYGLGEMVVQGKVTPDEFIVFKPTLGEGFRAIISRELGKKDKKMVYSKNGTAVLRVKKSDSSVYSLKDEEVLSLSKWCVSIEKYFSDKYGKYQPMDIEWAKDGESGALFIVQARPETVHSGSSKDIYKEFVLKEKGREIIRGTAVGTKIAVGKVNVLRNAKNISDFKKGEILVTEITDPDWEPIMKIASAIVTDKGGRTSHAAIVSRELGIPAIVGTGNATKVLKSGEDITADCSSGKDGIVYGGKLEFEIIERDISGFPEIKTKLVVNIGAPNEAFKNSFLPVKGVGLGRLEFIINSYIRIHPRALIDYKDLKRSKDTSIKNIVKIIEAETLGYQDKKQFYVDRLAEGIAKIGAAFWPHDVIIRFSDFKTNEYRSLVGGILYEPDEENPMIGWRGASRYTDENFKEPFRLECLAIKKVREEMGLKNIIPMVPFVRTLEEGAKTVELIKSNGLGGKNNNLKIYMMCEVPSNVVLADEFLEIFDGMSIGSNDLTQLVLGIDRDSAILSKVGNEKNKAVMKMIKEVIIKCREKGKYVGICGQAPSDYPEFTKFLVDNGIESISLNPDAVIPAFKVISEAEAGSRRS